MGLFFVTQKSIGSNVYYVHVFACKCVCMSMRVFEDLRNIIQCVPEEWKPINQVNYSENCNDLFKRVYIVIKFSLSSFV